MGGKLGFGGRMGWGLLSFFRGIWGFLMDGFQMGLGIEGVVLGLVCFERLIDS